MKPIKLYWCRGAGRTDPAMQNFGDYLSPLLVEILSARNVQYAPVKNADLIAIGSVLAREAKAKKWGVIPRKLHIWGAGTAAEAVSYSGRHYYHAVRGALTAEQIDGGSCTPVLGDPGLLAPWVFDGPERPRTKKYKVGIVPHYADQKERVLLELQSTLPGAKIINVFSPVKQVIAEIASCDFVLSSSMHGLIVADAFGVPNQWLKLSHGKISDYKFSDYYSVFGISDVQPVYSQQIIQGGPQIIEAYKSTYIRDGMKKIQEDLLGSFPKL